MKYLKLLLIIFPILCFGQNTDNQWEDLFSYYQVENLSYGDGQVFAAAENAVFAYTRNTGEIKKISSVNGLSGERISAMHYSSDYNLLILGYENGLIDIYDPAEEEVFTLIEIPEKQSIPPNEKQINHFHEDTGRLFIATDYGISEINLPNREFGDTYFIGTGGTRLVVNQITTYNNRIYAATESGLRWAGINNPNLINFASWTSIGNENITGVASLGAALYAINSNNTLLKLQQNNLLPEQQFNQSVRELRSIGDRLVISLSQRVQIYNQSLSIIADVGNPSGSTANYRAGLIISGEIYIADTNQGLLKTTLTNPFTFRFLSPNGPLLNNVYDLESTANELWVTYGEATGELNPYPLNERGVSHRVNEEWMNIPYEDIGAESIVSAAVNPNQPNQVFMGSFVRGLLAFQDNELTAIYNANNTSLQETIDGDGNAVPNDTRVNGIAFDRSGNLWGNVSLVENGLFRFSVASQQLETFSTTSVMPDFTGETYGSTKLVIDDAQNVYFGTGGYGVIGYQPSTDRFARVMGREGSGNLPDDFVRALAIDNNNQLWIGTGFGLRVLFSPSVMFDDPATSASEIIILDDDGVAQELLAENNILAITVDGNNNKWIGTDAGAFYLSSDGQETIYQFNKNNSPLPSNVVTDIAVDPSTGKVYIGTDRGLVAFRGSATQSAEDLENVRAFPNPVRPNYSGMVTIDGLIENANVKITDIEGNLVFEETSQGGSVQWDTRAFGRHKVASGVYLVMVTSDDQLQTKIAKIMVIR